MLFNFGYTSAILTWLLNPKCHCIIETALYLPLVRLRSFWLKAVMQHIRRRDLSS